MDYFFANKKDIKNNIVTIKGSEFKHLKNVLRSKVGDRIVVITGDGEEYHCVISKFRSHYIKAETSKITRNTNERSVYVSIAIASPRAKRMDWFVEKATEIGVREIIPVITKRSVVIPEVAKIRRWKKIAISAVKQSKRSILPEFRKPLDFEDFVSKRLGFSLKFIAYEKEYASSIEENMRGKSAKKVLVLVGPEGGFEREEFDKAIEQGFVPISLGVTRLRTETAGIVALCQILGFSSPAK